MAAVDSLRTHLVEELADLLSAEEQLTEALPKLAQSATSRPLRAAFQKHLKETRGHISRLKEAMRSLGEKPEAKTCEAMEGLLEEGESHMNEAPEGPVRDAVMITGAQKVEHYEMASYGTVRTYAQVLGETAVARLLEQTFAEEKKADSTLTQIAEDSVNEEAAQAWQSEEPAESPLSKPAEWVGATAAAASKRLAAGVRRAAAAAGVVNDRQGRTRRRRAGSRKQSSTRGRRAGGGRKKR